MEIEPYREIYRCIDEMFYAIEKQSKTSNYAESLFSLEAEMFWKYQALYKFGNLIYESSTRYMTCEEAKRLEMHGNDQKNYVYPQPVSSVPQKWTYKAEETHTVEDL